MVSLEEAVVARLKYHGHNFEILVDPDLALKLKDGEEVDFKELLAIDNVFKDASSGEKASEELMDDVFKTTDVEEIATKIINDGEVHLTAKQREQMLEDKRKQIINTIAKNAFNPQTRTPHPPSRIEKAMEEAGFNVDLHESVEKQVDEVLKEIRKIIPIRFDTVQVAAKIPPTYAGSAYGPLRDYSTLKKEEWDSEGNLILLIEMPAGLQDEFYNKVNSITHGEGEVKRLDRGV